MKLWSSFVKELRIASRGFYFYVELLMALILLLVLLFVVPERFDTREEEYLYVRFPTAQAQAAYLDALLDLDGQPEPAALQAEGRTVDAQLYETADARIYVLPTESDVALLSKARQHIGAAVLWSDADGALRYTYYLQGNETERLKRLLLVLHGPDDAALYAKADAQEVRLLGDARDPLTDRENLLPVVLAFNGVLTGFFIIAAYLFLDKKEGVLRAYAVTPASLRTYLLSKAMVLTATMLVTSVGLVLPVMRAPLSYPLLVLFLLCTGLFASGLGLVVAGYFDTMEKAFGVLYLLMIGLMIPMLAYYTPGWDPLWLRFLPSYYLLFGLQALFRGGDEAFVTLVALGYLGAAALLFAWAELRYRRTLTVQEG